MSTGRNQVALDRVKSNLLDAMGETVRGLLAEPDVTDIILNPPLPGEDKGRLWVSRLGRDREPVGFMTADQAMRLIGAVAASMNAEVNEDHPKVQGHLIVDGSRFQGCIPPITQAPFFAIRKHASAVFTLQSYVDRGLMTERQRAIIETGIAERRNILIVGGTGSGKTTLLNSILLAMSEINPDHRFFGIEDTVELMCSARDQTFTRTSATVDIRELVKIAMRSFADRIIIGEARDGAFLDILMAWNTGHPGGAATVHSDITSPYAALRRVELLLLLATASPMHTLVADAVHLIVCVERSKAGVRRVSQIVSVKGHDGHAYQLQTET